MTIYEELRKDHQKVLGLIEKLLEPENTNKKTRESLLRQIGDELIPHARAEEAVLYNSLRDIETASGVVAHAYQEHMEVEALFRTLQATEAMNMNWENGVKKLKTFLTHHINEEETEVFRAAKKLFTEEEAIEMAIVFTQMKPLVKEQSALGQATDMLINMMPSRLREAFKKFGTEGAMSQAS